MEGIIKKVVFGLILLAFLFYVYSDQNAKDVSMDKIKEALVKDEAVAAMEEGTARDVMHYFGIDVNSYEGVIYFKGTEALSVNELLIVKGSSRDAVSPVRDAIDSRVDAQIKTFEGYGPEQVALLNDHIVFQKGNYIFYCTDGQSGRIAEEFRDVI